MLVYYSQNFNNNYFNFFLRLQKALEYISYHSYSSNSSNNSFFADGPTNVFKHVLTSINMISLPPKWFIDIDHEYKDLNKPFVGFHQLGPCRDDFSRVVKKQIILTEGVF